MIPKYQYAGFWIRFLAHLIDSTFLTFVSWLLEWGILWIFYGISTLFSTAGGTLPTFEDAFNSFFLQIFNAGIYFCLAFPYYVWGHFKWGTTLGKKVFGIRVVSEITGENISLNQSITRFFLYGFSYVVMGLGFLMAAFQPRKQGLHDIFAHTVSVRPESSTPEFH